MSSTVELVHMEMDEVNLASPINYADVQLWVNGIQLLIIESVLLNLVVDSINYLLAYFYSNE